MKRGRRLFTPKPLLRLQWRLYGGKVIPPLSVVKLLAKWGNDQGRIFRIGYYSQQDGLNCIWLVNESGEYEQATDQKSMGKEFEVLYLSNETDLYGVDRDLLGAVRTDELLALNPA
jgi:hypothetical protein